MSSPLDTGKKLSYSEYRLFPADGKRHEVIDGDHYVNPAPSPQHQQISWRIASQLDSLIVRPGHGIAFSAPIDLQLTPHDIVQPDLIVLLGDQKRLVTPTKIKGVPALVIEILSASNAQYDRELKRELYERAGVPEYWIVDPDEHLVEQLLLESGSYRLLGAESERVEYRGLEGITVDLTEVW